MNGAGETGAATPGASARALLQSVEDLQRQAADILAIDASSLVTVASAYQQLRSEMVRRELGTIPIDRIKEASDGRLRLGALEQAGYRTVLSVFDAPPYRLEAVSGVGRRTAIQVHAAAQQVAAAVEHSLRVRVDLDPSNAKSTALLTGLHALSVAEATVGPVREASLGLTTELPAVVKAASLTRSRIRMFFASGARKRAALEALEEVKKWQDEAVATGFATALLTALETNRTSVLSPAEVWKDFEVRSPEYYGLLGEVVDLKLDVAAAEGFLPAEIVAAVNEQQLDDTFRNVSLRGYQSFGARFALVQRRVIIGDEMGLGKTIQAIAVVAHLRSMGSTHFLVVCPTSVLINWTREVTTRSTMKAYALHGSDRSRNLASWIKWGDVAITTFESLRALKIPADVRVGLLIVDEAHYVKNPAARRSQNVAAWAERVDRVLFLTGTPMENRVDEFRNLVQYLQPGLTGGVGGALGIAGPDAFRHAVAPVYLRRNQEDVLTELPELMQIDEWTEFSRFDKRAYLEALGSGNFMAMRRAGYATSDPQNSAKLSRLTEIAEEANDNGHKVVVFSFFRDVLRTVHASLGTVAMGPLTGDVPPLKRQALVDQFTQAKGPAVLVAQIQAGGVGLNLQAASVVVLCEPQVKPTMEDQAIARAHRMGQVRSVQVHRLLTADSVDQRMLEILDIKKRLFDDYARRSDIAEHAPGAVDISEVELARQVVAEEQERYALELMSATQSPPAPNSPHTE